MLSNKLTCNGMNAKSNRSCICRRNSAFWYVRIDGADATVIVTDGRNLGMAKAVADVDGENQGGFGSDNSNITGFSHMHDSGTVGNH